MKTTDRPKAQADQKKIVKISCDIYVEASEAFADKLLQDDTRLTGYIFPNNSRMIKRIRKKLHCEGEIGYWYNAQEEMYSLDIMHYKNK